MKQVTLSQGKVALVDDEDFEYLSQWDWHTERHGTRFYAIRKQGTFPFKKTVYMHRVIMNTPIDMECDHIDNNGLNNTRGNLRNCTNTQNKQNRKMQSNNTSGYKGVSLQKGKWCAQINVNGKRVFLGNFSNIEDAARAYDEAARKYHGDFANTNF